MEKTFTAIASLALLFIGTSSFAQQDPQFTMNMFNRLYANPGYAGSNNGICAKVGTDQVKKKDMKNFDVFV